MDKDNVILVQRSGDIRVSKDEATVLQDMFQDYARIALEAEFGMGFSGCRVFQVRPVEASGIAHRPALIKIGPVGLINKEWQAYNAWVKNTLPGIAYVTSEPIITPGSSQGGLQYELIGSGIFEIQSLSQYFRQASTEDLLWVLQKRLFPVMSRSWWLVNQAESTFQFSSDYDQLLPINLLATATKYSENGETRFISPVERSLTEAAIGSQVRFEGFVITELNPGKRQLTLNLPRPDQNRMADSLRLRIEGVPKFRDYQVGDLIEPLHGTVTATRHSMLESLVKNIVGDEVDLSLAKLRLPNGSETTNPLLVYKGLLNSFTQVNVSTIHGDFNLENILIDPDTRDVKVIDFATVRRGHNLHDLLRLETGVITKLIPEIFNSAALPPETIQTFYSQLVRADFDSRAQIEPQLLHPSLEKPFAMIRAIRQEARKCSFNPDEAREYYQGLVIYLLGALKFDDLDAIKNAKLVAFLGAGAIVDQLNATSYPVKAPVSAPYPEPKAEQIGREKGLVARVPRLWIGIGLVLLAILSGWIIYEVFFDGSNAPVIDVEHLHEIENNLVREPVDGPAAAGDLLTYFSMANPDLFAHIDQVERTYLAGEIDQGITYIWGSPGVGKSFITRNRLNEGFPGDSCLIKLGDVFGKESKDLSFEVINKPDLVTLDGGQAFDSLPAVAQAIDYELESLFEVAECTQNGGLLPLIIIDDIDEVHSDTSKLILSSLDRFILDTAEADKEFVHVIVIGRSEGFNPWFQDSKRIGDIIEYLSVFHLNGPELVTSGDVEIIADSQFAFENGMETWEKMKQDGEAADLIDGYLRYVEEHPFLTYSIQALRIALFITDRSSSSPDDSETELKQFLLDELLRLASDVHGRPLSNDLQYRRILEDIAVLYASEEKVDDQGFFTVGLNDTVAVMEGEQSVGEVRVRDVLDHSGIAILEPASLSTARYRFEPAWVHSYLVELHNQRLNENKG